MIQTQIELTEEQMSALEKLAKKRRISLSELVRESITNSLRSDVARSDSEMKRKALDIAGRFRSGLGDLSEGHDKYLSETYDR